MKNIKQKRSFYNHSLISSFVFIFTTVLLLSFSYILSISLHNTAWAIPNRLLTNNTISNNKLNNTITSPASSPSPTSLNHAPVANAGVNQIHFNSNEDHKETNQSDYNEVQDQLQEKQEEEAGAGDVNATTNQIF